MNLKDISKKFGYNQDYFEITKREIEDPNDKEKKTKIPLIVKYKVQNIFPLKQIFDKIQMKEFSLKSNQEGRENREPRNEKLNSSDIHYFLNRLTIGNNWVKCYNYFLYNLNVKLTLIQMIKTN